MDLMEKINKFMTSDKETVSCVEDISYIAGKWLVSCVRNLVKIQQREE